MPIPDNLYKIELSGIWQDESGIAPIPRWPWAMTWYCTSNEVTDDPVRLGSYASEWGIWFTKGLANTPWAAQGTVANVIRGIRVASGAFGEFPQDLAVVAGPSPPVPPQVALFVVGRTNTMGRQTRKWIPCLQQDALEPHQPRWSIDLTGPTSLNEYAFAALQPKAAGAGVTLTPIVWDADAEEVSPIIQLRVSAWPRTIRRRSLRAPEEWKVQP